MELTQAAKLHRAATGSLHLAYHLDEWAVLQEFASTPNGQTHGRTLLTAAETLQRSAAVNPAGLLGALWSPTEVTVDPRQAIRALPGYLSERYPITFVYGTTVRAVHVPTVETTNGTFRADRVIVCGGHDFETLYPDALAAAPLTRCKLQMLRTVPQPATWSLGPALCAGLTLTHYDSFKACSTLSPLQARFRREKPFEVEHGIHVLLSQTNAGELTIGDSHTYGMTIQPFDREDINQSILRYLRSFTQVPSFDLGERWHGVYAKTTNGASEVVIDAAPGVRVVTGLGGAGMTLSFGLAEEVFANW